MLRANANICFCGVGSKEGHEPFFDRGETLIEIQPTHVRLTMGRGILSVRVRRNQPEKTNFEDVG